MTMILKLVRIGLLTKSEAKFATRLVDNGVLAVNPSIDEVISAIV